MIAGWISRAAPARRLPWAIALLLGAAIVAVASLPTGSPSFQGVVPPGGRLAAHQRVGHAQVLVIAQPGGTLQIEVAYREPKGWFGVLLDRPPVAGADVAWAGTSGRGRIPAMSAVYGRDDRAASGVIVDWSDGRRTAVAVGDGLFLAAREGYVHSRNVRLVAANGAVLTEVPGP